MIFNKKIYIYCILHALLLTNRLDGKSENGIDNPQSSEVPAHSGKAKLDGTGKWQINNDREHFFLLSIVCPLRLASDPRVMIRVL